MRSHSAIGVLAASLIALGSATHAQILQPTFSLEPSAEDLPTFPPPSSSHFGTAVAVHRNTAMASIPGLDPPRVAVFTRDAAGMWQRTDTLLDEPAFAIAIDGDHALLSGPNRLSAYQRQGNAWSRVQTIATPDTVMDIEIDGDTAAYVTAADVDLRELQIQFLHFSRKKQLWDKGRPLQPSKPFGNSLALANNTLVLQGSGLVYVFQHVGRTWRERQTLLPADGEPSFGSEVAISGDRIVVAARGADFSNDYGLSNGKVYVFDRRGRFWFETQELQPSFEALGGRGQFGSQVAVTPTTLAVSTEAGMIFDGATTVIYETHGRGRPYELVGRLDVGARPLAILDAWRNTVLVGVPWDEHGAPWHIGYALGYVVPQGQ
ncbi:MAG: FG-GAP repeat protein [Steroidobacteraceae bacterium]